MNVSKEESKNAQPQSSRNRQYDRKVSGFGWQSDQSDQESEKPKTEIHDINPHKDKLDEPAHNIFLIADKQKFEILREEHLRNGTLFEDPEFPDAMESLCGLSKSDLKKDLRARYGDIKWLRPTDIVKLKDPSKVPHFSVDGFSRFDVNQGGLGHCWAVAAIASLTMHPHLFGKVVPDDQSFNKDKYAGIFHFKFWQFGKWIDVVVDDRLPTKKGVLCFVRSKADNEFWISLLEKAYAKLYGCYQAIVGGMAFDAMQDFTGGVVEAFNSKDMEETTSQEIFTIILKAYQRGSLISSGCAVEEEKKEEFMNTYGLISGHAYSITSANTIETSNPQEKRVQLLRLRNPWGNAYEWKKAWSDDDTDRWQTVSKDVQKQIGFKADHDGEFWISLHDYKTHFNDLDICHLTPDWLSKENYGKESSKERKWHMSMIDGAWVKGVTTGGVTRMYKNPQYQITLTEPDEDDKDSKCTLVVSLMQKHRRAMKIQGAGNLFIGFNIYYLPHPDQISKPLNDMFFKNKPKSVGHPWNFEDRREVNCRFNFSTGTYCIIPCTYESEQEGSFMLRIFTEKKSNMKEHDDDIRLEELANQENKSGIQRGMRTSISLYDYEQERDRKIMEKFLKFGKKDLEINWHELKEILDSDMKKNTKGNGFSEDVCRSIVALADTDHSGKLDYEEFKKLWIDVTYWKEAFESEDKNKTGSIDCYELREALLSTGYHVNNHILIDLMHRYGNKEHKFSFELFILCTLKVKTMLALFNTKFDGKNHTANFRLDDFMEGTLYS